ncbi:MAG: glycoside hydrolase N-terminal domain-containing protein, partial [Akkermansiaceae bacterium]|nr:glycoside hydrolase N-terminal domain-containing protein [Akkermansiaceae bacterium]
MSPKALLLLLLTIPACWQLHAAAPDRGFVSRQPAASWEQALVTGNGIQGAMVYGVPDQETIILNHGRLYLPLHPPLPPPDTASRLPELRRLMAEEKFQQAAEQVVTIADQAGYGGKRWTDPFIPACDLTLSQPASGTTTAYQRSVDFASGVAAVEWHDDRGGFARRVFVSRADNVIALSLTGPGKGAVDCQLELSTRPAAGQGGWGAERMFQTGIKDTTAAAGGGFLTYRADFRRSWPGSLQGYEVTARVITTGGSTTTDGGSIHISGADEVVVLARIHPLTDAGHSRQPQTKAALAALPPDFNALLARHTAIHGPLFRRVRLDLGGNDDRSLSSEEVLEKSKVGQLSPALLEKVFDSGRYVILSSSGEVFPNLQGIWNGTWSPPWSADFTLNGNVQCALAADLSGNLAECLLPFFNYLEEHLPEFRTNARRLYGCRGIHVPSRASTHGLNNHFDATWPMTFWTAGAAWAARFYHDYAIYTGDREFLANRAVPFMKEAALFYEDFLIEGPDGKLLFSPSYSPENNPANNPSQACVNATMDAAAARELLINLVADCQSLGTDEEAVKRWQTMLAKLPPYQINADGAVKEWLTPALEDNYAHRHVSHLYPLFAGLPEEIAVDAPLQLAFRTALEKRMEIRRRENGGVMAFGLVQMGLAAAALRDSAMAYETVDWLTNNFWNANLVSTHNPGELFNTDICGGLPAVVLAMLVDSRPGHLDLLPALPKQWPRGCVEGVRCRGN